MSNETEYFLSQDGLKLYYRNWLPQNAENVVCIAHGLGEHSGRYKHVGEYLAKHKSAVFALDLRGHGISQGKRGHSRRYDLLLSDVEELLKTARAEYTDLPLFLMGHSLGGNLVANYMIQMNVNDVAGFILSSPWLRLAFEPPKWKLQLGKMITGIFPGFSQPNGLIAEQISKDEEVVTAYQNDPLVHNKITAGLYSQVTKAGEQAIKDSKAISAQGLIYHGNADKITDWKSTRQFAESCPDVQWTELENVYHEPHNDLERDQVLQLLSDWLKNKTETFESKF